MVEQMELLQRMCLKNRFKFVAGLLLLLYKSLTVSGTTNNGQCPQKISLDSTESNERLLPILKTWETCMLLIVGFCGFSILLAILYNSLRKHVFKDANNLDTTFDAGGRVTLSLTAVTVAMQLLWPADFLQSATITTWNGVAAPFCYAVGIVINILIFPTLSLYFKTRAPGAKTYLQVIYARYGAPTHIVYCCFALLTNVVITTCLVLAAHSTITTLTENVSNELLVTLLALMFGSYSFIGGLGTTFYVSYFNAAMIFIMIISMTVKMYYLDGDFGEFSSAIGNIDKLYDSLSCLKHDGHPAPNMENSFVTFRSTGSFIFGIIGVFLASSMIFCDQAAWQSRIAAKPTQGVLGFLIGAFIWYAMPSTLTTNTGLAYLSMSSVGNHTHLLTDADISAGLVTPFVAQALLGKAGAIMVLSVISMALMSTGSGEVMAISSIVIYDIYQKYIKPFSTDSNLQIPEDNEGSVIANNDDMASGSEDDSIYLNESLSGSLPSTHCLICGMIKYTALAGNEDKHYEEAICRCKSPLVCQYCIDDKRILDENSSKKHVYYSKKYNCPTHGEFRSYQDMLMRFKDWYIVWTSLAIVPFGLAVINSGIDLTWAFTTGAVLAIPFCPTVFLSIVWVKTTGTALIVGGICGVLSGVIVNLSIAATIYDNGLSDFVFNTSQDWSVLGGCCTSFSISLVLTIVVSLCTHNVKTEADVQGEWAKTMSIDNPLNAWVMKYQDDFKTNLIDRPPTHEELAEKFKTAKYIAYGGSFVAMIVLLVVMPIALVTRDVLDKYEFKCWIHFCHIWTCIAGCFVVFVPPIQEIYTIVKQHRENKKILKYSNEVKSTGNTLDTLI